jgi:hypothetical protein
MLNPALKHMLYIIVLSVLQFLASVTEAEGLLPPPTFFVTPFDLDKRPSN